MQLLESLKQLNGITGYANMVKEPLQDVNCVENFLHMYGSIIMFFVCLLLLYLAIKKNYEPLLLLPIGFGGILANIPVAGIAEPGGFYILFIILVLMVVYSHYSYLWVLVQ